jgi:fermentation-respiration switch protein FrsA (DUF1100 family)
MLDIVRPITNLILFYYAQQCDCEVCLPDCKEVTIKNPGGAKLNAWYLTVPNPSFHIVYSHGMYNCLCPYADDLEYLRTHYNASVLCYDYSGHGKSTGKPDVDGIVEDGKAAVNWLCKKKKIKPSDVVLCGYSIGGAVSAQLAKIFNPKGLIIEGSFASLSNMAGYMQECVPDYLPVGDMLGYLTAGQLDSVAAIAKYRGPFLQSHSDTDEIVPYESGRMLFDACPSKNKTFVTVHGKTHEDPHSKLYRKKQREFFDSLRKRR